MRTVSSLTAQLAQRAGRKPQTIVDLQAREAAQTIQLKSLGELAEAMDCELVYAIVPRKPLDTILDERARSVARQALRRIDPDEAVTLIPSYIAPQQDPEAVGSSYRMLLLNWRPIAIR